MDQQQDSSLFGLSIDTFSRTHLKEAARWAKFLAIVGFIISGLIILTGLFFRYFTSALSREYDGSTGFSEDMGVFIVFIYIGGALLYFFPCLFLYQFAARMKTALQSDSQDTLNASFQSLKKMFRFVGILTIIFLSFYGFALIIALISPGIGQS